MANILFMDSGGDNTSDLSAWSTSTSATVTTSSPITGTSSISIAASNSNVTRNNVAVDAGRRVTANYRFLNGLPSGAASTSQAILNIGSVILIHLDCLNNVLLVKNNGGTTLGTGTTVIGTSVFNLGVSYTITSTTVNQIRVYINGSLEISVSNGTLSNTMAGLSTNNVTYGYGTSTGIVTKTIFLMDDFYVDDGTDLAFPGKICVTAKDPISDNSNSFDTTIGTSRAAGSRFLNINQNPISDSDGWKHAAATSVTEKYNVQGVAVGDVDISTATIVGNQFWVRAKRDGVWNVDNASNNSSSSVVKSASTTSACNFSAAVTAGYTIVAILACDPVTGTPTCADNSGLGYTWTRIAFNTTNTTAGTATQVHVFATYASSGLPSSAFITVTHTSVTARAISAIGFPGLLTASPLGNSVSATGTTSTTTPVSSGSVTPSQANFWAVAVASYEGPNTDVVKAIINYGGSDDATTTSNSFYVGGAADGTTGGSAATNVSLAVSIKAYTTAAALIAKASNTTAARTAVSMMLWFKATGTAGTPTIAWSHAGGSGTTSTTLTNTAAYYTSYATTTSAPTVVGMNSSGTAVATYLYEAGTQVAYIPSAGVTPTLKNKMLLLGVGR